MRSTGAIITEIIEAYGNRFGQWVSINEIADKTGLTEAELAEGITELMEDQEHFWAEPEVHGHRTISRAQYDAGVRPVAPVIGGEARHKICWER